MRLLFESELNAFRNQIVSEFERSLEPISHADLQQIFDLHRLELLLNELEGEMIYLGCPRSGFEYFLNEVAQRNFPE